MVWMRNQPDFGVAFLGGSGGKQKGHTSSWPRLMLRQTQMGVALQRAGETWQWGARPCGGVFCFKYSLFVSLKGNPKGKPESWGVPH